MMTFAVVIPFHLFYGAAAYAPEGEWDGETFRFLYFLVLLRITVYVFWSLWSSPRRVRRLRPPPVPNILWLSLGSTFSWRCTAHCRRPTQPRHYHLVRCIWRRSRLRSWDRPTFERPRAPKRFLSGCRGLDVECTWACRLNIPVPLLKFST